MTIEQRNTISLEDIVSLEYSCSHCDSKYTVPLKRFDRVLYQCPNCKQEVVSGAHQSDRKPSDDEALAMLLGNLRDVQARNIPIRFEISSSGHAASDRD